ncbi:metal-dependent hydrolase [Halomicrobium sp. HM KBTZ05]|uniref:metal-dependent hydrolase n=1 Tax=Halomicrobium sp. HM KBTZ05 TaxID=3242663 RepID=UPI003556989D
MMVLTHILVGLSLAVPVTVVAPSLAGPAALGGIIGGFVPDLDLLGGQHRKTLHFPVLGLIPPGAGVVVALLVPGPLTAAVAVGGVAFVVHSASDALGGGRELRPWERTNTDAVYDHYRGRWLAARYLVPYDGHPRDLLVAVLAAIPVLAVYDGPVRWVTVSALLLGTVYALVRKRIPKYVRPIVE